MVPAVTSRVPVPEPEPGPTLMPRLAVRVKEALVERVPPLMTMLFGVALPGALPRLASAPMLRTPLVMVVPPV